MNVIVGNLNNSKFLNLDVDIIKTINGEFSADEIVQTFSNFFFNRMFLDITAIENYKDISNLKKISVGLDVSKIILLLSEDGSINDNYISNLINMGFYNFARSESEIKYLYDNPNSYKDVAHLQKMNSVVSMPITNNNVVTNNYNNNITSLVDDDDSYSDSGVKVIGFKNFTNHAGATSLIYMLKNVLANNYNVVAVEVNKRDFLFLRDPNMISIEANRVSDIISRHNSADIILVDLNDLDMGIAKSVCTDIIYLMESSTLMINKVITIDNECFKKISQYKVILNQSMLDSKDVSRLQFESGIKFFAVIPPLDDRRDNDKYLLPVLEKLGLYKTK